MENKPLLDSEISIKEKFKALSPKKNIAIYGNIIKCI